MPEANIEKLGSEAVILGLDYGLKRIGVALGNLLVSEARPLQIIHWTTNEQKWQQLASIIKNWEPDAVVVGVPFHPDGAPNSMTEVCRKFGRQVEGRYGLPVFFEDERFSSVDAESEYGNDDYIDDEAASVILQQWFEKAKIQRGGAL